MSTPSILSIQSSVTYGHVGNSAAVFPMQYRGVNVSALHTLQYSSHVQYSGGFAGTKIPAPDISAVLSKLHALDESSLRSPSLFTHILTGYIGTPEAVEAIAEFVKETKARGVTEGKAPPFFFCDPVCGDNGRLYVLEAVAAGIKSSLIPQADAIAPNFFEATYLSGIHIDDDASAMNAAKKLHDMGPRIVIITSYASKDDDGDDDNKDNSKKRLHCLLSRKVASAEGEGQQTFSYKQDVYSFENIPGHWVGTGDTFAALILSELAIKNDEERLPGIVKNSILIMNSLVRDTNDNQTVLGGQRELRIIENRSLFELEEKHHSHHHHHQQAINKDACEHTVKS